MIIGRLSARGTHAGLAASLSLYKVHVGLIIWYAKYSGECKIERSEVESTICIGKGR